MLDLITDIASFAGLPVVGSAVGLLGNWLNKKQARTDRALEYEHELKMLELNNRLASDQHERNLTLADRKIQEITTHGELEGFVESQRVTDGWMEKAKAIVRPLLTLYLVMLTTYMAWSLNTLIADNQPALTDTGATYPHIVNTVLFLTTTAITWWFGARPPHKTTK